MNFTERHAYVTANRRRKQTTHAELAKGVLLVRALRFVNHNDLVDGGSHEVCAAWGLNSVDVVDAPMVVEVENV